MCVVEVKVREAYAVKLCLFHRYQGQTGRSKVYKEAILKKIYPTQQAKQAFCPSYIVVFFVLFPVL